MDRKEAEDVTGSVCQLPYLQPDVQCIVVIFLILVLSTTSQSIHAKISGSRLSLQGPRLLMVIASVSIGGGPMSLVYCVDGGDQHYPVQSLVRFEEKPHLSKYVAHSSSLYLVCVHEHEKAQFQKHVLSRLS